MKSADIYSIGKLFPFINLKSSEKKLKFILFPYSCKEVIGTSLIVFFLSVFLGFFFSIFSSFLMYASVYLGLILSIGLYVYPTSIYYTKQIIDYREDMLLFLMKISTYLSMNTSLEYAMEKTKDELYGILRLQFNEIFRMLKVKEKSNLGDCLSVYIPIWNKINPDFVKALKMLQTASVSSKDEREEIINEVIDTIIVSYHNIGKRFSENLASKSKSLVAVGILLPIISLMLLPIVSIFLPDIVSGGMISFIYNIFFPTVLLLMALDFSANRVQVNTVRIEDSLNYKKIPTLLYLLSGLIVGLVSIPTVLHIRSIDLTSVETAAREYTFSSILTVLSFSFGVMLVIYLITNYYVKRNSEIWEEIDSTEQDFPYLLQIFSTYLSLNRSVESIIPEIINDYEVHGHKDHAMVKIFKELKKNIFTTKKTIKDICRQVLPKICYSNKVTETINHIISFTDISLKNAARAAKMIRKQNLSIFKLDDYIKSLLSETVSLINVTITMLAPLLSAAAVIMSLAIVMSLTFISKQLEAISTTLGSAASRLSLVDITQIVPPTIVLVVVSVYLLEMIIVLSIFVSNIKNGNDRFLLMKTLNNNVIVSYMIFAIILVVGFFAFKMTVFKGAFG